ncbi:hypothetical protein SAY86_004822 [Trapa natans]|uniref:Uncharacterized protein n=1 Tax=Trapa natans TaxID=22666 RepID=A0AAN7MF51_TRANT|nr:hypothetical protein SAY86_004822 [Trapa natans]
MDKGKKVASATDFLQNLKLSSVSSSRPDPSYTRITASLRPKGAPDKKTKPPSLVGLCLMVVGKHFEDIVSDLEAIAGCFPADVKMVMAAIARRRRLLDDNVILSLADSSWEILDLSGSDVSDRGLKELAKRCRSLRAVDISQCERITVASVSELVQQCHSLETLRCGGCQRSDYTARSCLSMLKPKLNDAAGESWEEIDATEIVHGAQSLNWLVWPRIDQGSVEDLATECPRIMVNPRPSPFSLRGMQVPREALPDIILDDPFVQEIDPTTWETKGSKPRQVSLSPNGSSDELSLAEKFRLAFMERDTRLAPKRAKSARQHQRRAEREWIAGDANARAVALASQVSKSLQTRKLG